MRLRERFPFSALFFTLFSMNIILFEEHELGKNLPPQDERTIHLSRVLRKPAGARFDAGVLGGNRGTGVIEGINPDGSLAYSLELHDPPPLRSPLRMCVGFPRPIQLRRLLRALANLGAGAIDLIGTDLGDKNYRDTKLLADGGARAALIDGAAQARDTVIPGLSVYPTLDSWLETRPWTEVPDSGLVAADNEDPQGALSQYAVEGRRSMTVAVGSERGWSDRERRRLEGAGFQRLSLGSRALRTETACVAAAVLAMEKLGELG
jgi:RsmE family RNA methyltransferase